MNPTALLVGSVKTNVGHLESAAGVAGLIKTVLAMHRGVIPPHLHFNNPTPEVDWERLPLRITSEATRWPLSPDRPPLAGVNVFGISGANAHAVVEGYGTPGGTEADSNGRRPAGVPVAVPAEATGDVPAAEEPVSRGRRLLPLSAKTPEALAELAGSYLTWLEACADGAESAASAVDGTLADMAWTAGVGRTHFEHRAGLVFGDGESLRAGLAAVSAGDPVPDGDPPDPHGMPPEEADVLAAAEAYEAGREVSFERLFAGETRRRIARPGYPFQRLRHWVDAPGFRPSPE